MDWTEAGEPAARLFFNLLNINASRLVHHRGFGTDARLKLVNHVMIVKTLAKAHAVFIETTFLITARHAEGGDQGLTRPVYHAADDRNIHRRDNIFQPLFKLIYRADNIELLAGTGGTSNKIDTP